MHIIAVDWSDKAEGPAESLWRAEVRHGKLTELRNGLGRNELIAKLLELGEVEPRTVVGLDFALSFPAWWREEKGWSNGEDVWSAMGREGEDPICGRSGYPYRHYYRPRQPVAWGVNGAREPPRGEALPLS